METILGVVGFLLAVGLAADQLAYAKVKDRFLKRILRAKQESITRYVSSLALDTFEYIFADKFISLRFFKKSALYTLLGLIVGLIFLYFVYPQTYVSATSSFRIYTDNSYGIALVIAPIIVFVFCDYACNGQTRYFLQIMRSSDSLAKFSAIGYGDLVVTISFGILSTCCAVLVYSYLFIPASSITTNVSLDFSSLRSDLTRYQRELELGDGSAASRAIISHPSAKVEAEFSKRELKIFESETDLVESGLLDSKQVRYSIVSSKPANGREFYRAEDEQGNRVMAEHYMFWFSSVTFQDLELIEQLEMICTKFAGLPIEPGFAFKLQGWSKKDVLEACLNEKATSMKINISPNDELISRRQLVGATAGDLVQHMLNSLTGGFKSYYGKGGVNLYKSIYDNTGSYNSRPIVDVGLEHYFIAQKWQIANGYRRHLENGGYPWATLFTVTLFTSLFIWLALLVALFLYPAVILISSYPSISSSLDIKNHPFTFCSVVLSFYCALIVLIF